MRSEVLNNLFTPVTRLKGIGPALGKTLSRVLPEGPGGSLPVVRDLLFHMPSGLIDRRATYPLNSCPSGVTATFVVMVEAHQPPPRRVGRKIPYRVLCSNDTGDITLVFFNASEDYIKQALPVGEMRAISGQTEIFDFRLQMTHPDVIAPAAQLEKVKTVEPVYPLTAGLTNRRLASIIRGALNHAPELPEWAPPETLKQHGWKSWKETLLATHAPHGEEDLSSASRVRERLAYDEILANQLYLALIRSRMDAKPGRAVKSTGALRKKLIEQLPFTLTKGQEQALAEIDGDMESGTRMVRLLQGDVGSGKTVVALLAALAAAENGLQTALMAPTEILARQHALTLSTLCKGLPVGITLLTGSIKGKSREVQLADIAAGRAHIVIGTHALFQEKVEFHDLALIVIDEQHRFGVAQRMAMSAKGEHPHLLHMTATPIPRSLTMTLYGDMDCTLLTEKPASRQAITTAVIPLSRISEVTEAISRALGKGEKIYWICPQIDDESTIAKDDAAAVELRHITFRTAFGESVGLVHGRMKAEEREEAMRRFAAGETRLLVATTVVEVGVDVPDATILIVEQAERFGLSQLHQLRGRVGRSDKASSCLLLYSDAAGEDARARLTILRETGDGFRIAEEDLAIRGGGELLGTRQSGIPRFRFTDLAVHQPLIIRAREEAKQILRKNRTLEGESGKALKLLLGLFGYEYGV